MARRNKRGGKANATGRNDTARFVGLPHYMLRCRAWQTLPPAAIALLIDLWQRHNGSNNGEISYSVREAEVIGLGSSHAGRMFGVLIERGFLKVRRASTFTLKTKEARTWEITAERCGDCPPSRDFMRWSPDRENKKQSHRREAQSPMRDTTAHGARRLPTLVPRVGPSSEKSTLPQSHEGDTYNLPSGEPVDGELVHADQSDIEAAVAASLSSSDPAPSLPHDTLIGDPDQHTTQPAGRQRHRSEPGKASEIERDPRQVDLVDWLNGAAASEKPAPVEQLRAELTAYLERSPKGEANRIAQRLGLSRPQIVNFKAGRFGINHTAAAALREYLKECAA